VVKINIPEPRTPNARAAASAQNPELARAASAQNPEPARAASPVSVRLYDIPDEGSDAYVFVDFIEFTYIFDQFGDHLFVYDG
jgi:hypothetical protein